MESESLVTNASGGAQRKGCFYVQVFIPGAITDVEVKTPLYGYHKRHFLFHHDCHGASEGTACVAHSSYAKCLYRKSDRVKMVIGLL